MHLAAKTTRIEVAKYLLRAGLNVNARMQNGLTPLHYAAQVSRGGWDFSSDGTGEIAMVKLLIEHGANVNAEAVASMMTAWRYNEKVTPLTATRWLLRTRWMRNA